MAAMGMAISAEEPVSAPPNANTGQRELFGYLSALDKIGSARLDAIDKSIASIDSKISADEFHGRLDRISTVLDTLAAQQEKMARKDAALRAALGASDEDVANEAKKRLHCQATRRRSEVPVSGLVE